MKFKPARLQALAITLAIGLSSWAGLANAADLKLKNVSYGLTRELYCCGLCSGGRQAGYCAFCLRLRCCEDLC